MSEKIERAKLLAMFVHLGQRRNDGEPYINHCERIANSLFQKFSYEHMKGIGLGESLTEEEEDMICAAYLHDAREDAEYPGAILIMIGTYFGGRVENLVDILTHKKNETYNEYITKVSQDSEAIQIKWLDMIDNCSYSIPPKQELKYKNACVFLKHLEIKIPKILEDKFKI